MCSLRLRATSIQLSLLSESFGGLGDGGEEGADRVVVKQAAGE